MSKNLDAVCLSHHTFPASTCLRQVLYIDKKSGYNPKKWAEVDHFVGFCCPETQRILELLADGKKNSFTKKR